VPAAAAAARGGRGRGTVDAADRGPGRGRVCRPGAGRPPAGTTRGAGRDGPAPGAEGVAVGGGPAPRGAPAGPAARAAPVARPAARITSRRGVGTHRHARSPAAAGDAGAGRPGGPADEGGEDVAGAADPADGRVEPEQFSAGPSGGARAASEAG